MYGLITFPRNCRQSERRADLPHGPRTEEAPIYILAHRKHSKQIISSFQANKTQSAASKQVAIEVNGHETANMGR